MTISDDERAAAERLVAASSLGTAEALAARRRAPAALVARALRLADHAAVIAVQMDPALVLDPGAFGANSPLRCFGATARHHGGAVTSTASGRVVVGFADVRDAFATAIAVAAPSLRLAIHAYPPAGGAVPPEAATEEALVLVGLGHGGQVLVSAAAEAAIADMLPAGGVLERAGRSPSGRPVYQLRHPSLRRRIPGLRRASSQCGDLPPPRSAFVGNGRALRAVTDALRPGRLVTLVGTAGSGKTRLALEAARRATPASFPAGVRFCDASTLTTADDLVTCLARAFERPPLVDHQRADGAAAGPPPVEGLRSKVVGSLQGRLLIVLDGCDAIDRPAAELLDDLTRPGSEATVLATSRDRLGRPGELVLEIGSITSTVEAAGGPSLATDLLARLVEPGHGVGSADGEGTGERPPLAAVAKRVEAVPLAVELVAPLLDEMTPDDVAAALEVTLDGGGGPPRALDAAVDVVLAALDPTAGRLFAALSVFSGGWALDAAEAVAMAAGVGPSDVAPALDRLVKHALIWDDRGEAGDVRHRLPDALRSHARARLAQAGQHAAVGAAHAAYYLGLARSASAPRRTPFEAAWAQAVDVDFDNVRVAHRWLVDRARYEDALRLTWYLADDVLMRGRHEVGHWAEALGRHPATAGSAMRSTALALASNTALVEGDHGRARRLAEASLADGEHEAVDGWWIAVNTLALLSARAGDDAERDRRFAQVLDAAERVGERFPQVVVWYERVWLGWLYSDFDGSRAAARTLRRLVGAGDSPSMQAMAALAEGMTSAGDDPVRAKHHLEHGLALAATAGNSLLHLQGARAKYRLSLPPADRLDACQRLREVAAEFRAQGNASEHAQTIVELARHLLHLDRYDEAAVLCGFVSQTPFRHSDRFLAAEREVGRTMTPRRRDAWRRGATMPETRFARFVDLAVEQARRAVETA